MISLNVNVNKVEKVVISSLSVLNNRFIIDFKSDAFEAAVFDEVFFKIKMKLNRSLAFFSTVAYFFWRFSFEIINEKKDKWFRCSIFLISLRLLR